MPPSTGVGYRESGAATLRSGLTWRLASLLTSLFSLSSVPHAAAESVVSRFDPAQAASMPTYTLSNCTKPEVTFGPQGFTTTISASVPASIYYGHCDLGPWGWVCKDPYSTYSDRHSQCSLGTCMFPTVISGVTVVRSRPDPHACTCASLDGCQPCRRFGAHVAASITQEESVGSTAPASSMGFAQCHPGPSGWVCEDPIRAQSASVSVSQSGKVSMAKCRFSPFGWYCDDTAHAKSVTSAPNASVPTSWARISGIKVRLYKPDPEEVTCWTHSDHTACRPLWMAMAAVPTRLETDTSKLTFTSTPVTLLATRQETPSLASSTSVSGASSLQNKSAWRLVSVLAIFWFFFSMPATTAAKSQPTCCRIQDGDEVPSSEFTTTLQLKPIAHGPCVHGSSNKYAQSSKQPWQSPDHREGPLDRRPAISTAPDHREAPVHAAALTTVTRTIHPDLPGNRCRPPKDCGWSTTHAWDWPTRPGVG